MIGVRPNAACTLFSHALASATVTYGGQPPQPSSFHSRSNTGGRSPARLPVYPVALTAAMNRSACAPPVPAAVAGEKGWGPTAGPALRAAARSVARYSSVVFRPRVALTVANSTPDA